MAAFNGFIWALMASLPARGKGGWRTFLALAILCTLLGYFFVIEPESHLCRGSARYQGFVRIKPQLQHLILSQNGTFSCIFTNGAGARIRIIADELSISGESPCTDYIVERENAPQGAEFWINATGCQRLEPDHAYTLQIAIPYEMNVSGSVTRKAENGEMTGCVAY
ncbi:MAG: hypothetical protein V1875_01045 [Candidatus Altiarchaeota archaeon]